MYTTFSVEIDEKLQKDFLKEIKIRRAKKEKILAKLMYFYIKNLIITDEEYKDDIAFDLAVTKAFQDKGVQDIFSKISNKLETIG